jgi:uncharacterized short protein YbdD (DUF466 family)
MRGGTSMKLATLRSRLAAVANKIWRGVREWCGDAAYERYLKSNSRRACAANLLTREQFYLEQLHKRYSRVSRCC